MAKSANLYARIEPDIKEQAESILAALGIPASNAINMFYKQIILNNGMSFELKIPKNKNTNISKMTEIEFNVSMEKAYQEMKDKKGISVTTAFSSIKRAE